MQKFKFLRMVLTFVMMLGLLSSTNVLQAYAAEGPRLSQTEYNLSGNYTGSGGAILNGSGTPSVTVTEGSAWLKVRLINNQTYSIEVAQNNTGKSRTGKFEITVNGKNLCATVNQAVYKDSNSGALDVLSCPTSCTYGEADIKLSFCSKYEWKVSVYVPNTNDPCAVEESYYFTTKNSGAGSSSIQSVGIHFPSNYSRNSRTLQVTIESRGLKITKNIIQEGTPRNINTLSDFDGGQYSIRYIYCSEKDDCTIVNCYFIAHDSWEVVNTSGGLEVNRKSGGPGRQIIRVKFPKYNHASHDFSLVIKTNDYAAILNYTLLGGGRPDNNSYWPANNGNNWNDITSNPTDNKGPYDWDKFLDLGNID